MPIKAVQTDQGHERRFGRRRPIAHHPHLKLHKYLMRGLPSPPAEVDYTKPATSALSQMYLNDRLGCCVIAGMAHLQGLFTGNAGTAPLIFTDQQIVQLYEAIGGYRPGNPDTDQGCDEQTALAYWQNRGAPLRSNHRITGWLGVDATDLEEVRIALWVFENLLFGIELPDAWVNPAPQSSGFVWDVAGDPNLDNGHCVVGVGYTSKGVMDCTWGLTGTITDAAVAKYAAPAASGELWTVISKDSLIKASRKTPAGLDWTQLVADFDALGGNLPSLA
jgi:hypothetical protein